MPSRTTHSLKGALETAGATLVRTAQTASGITLFEWQGRDSILHYQGSAHDVLSISLRGGSTCKHLKNGLDSGSGFNGAVCMFPLGEAQSQWRASGKWRLLHIRFASPSPGALSFREALQVRSPVLSTAANSLASADWSNASFLAGVDGVLNWISCHARADFGIAEPAVGRNQGQLSAAQADQLENFLRDSFGNPVRLEELAAICRLSRYHFVRKFKNTFGCPPHEYLTRLRMRHAYARLSESSEKVTSVAFECGYNQPAQFAAVFKRYFGYSPSEIRTRESSSNCYRGSAVALSGSRTEVIRGLTR